MPPSISDWVAEGSLADFYAKYRDDGWGRAAHHPRMMVKVEPVFGQMKRRGLIKFLLRGVEEVKAEWTLWRSTHNILKLWLCGYALEPAI
ncbi:MAG: hypothetical protein Kow0090_12510 [Myxococcota bacterium]